MTSNLPTTRTDGALTTPLTAAGLSGEFGQQDVVIPVCSLVQPMSKDRGDAGHFWFPDGLVLDVMHVVVLDVVATRTMFGNIDQGEGILCKSPDRVMGYTDKPSRVLGGKQKDGETVAVTCRDCPHFGDDQFARGELCKFGYTLLLWEYDREFPFVYFVKGSAFKPVKQKIVSPALMRAQQGEAPEPWRTIFEFKPKLVQDNFKYWVPEITPVEEVSDEERALFAQKSADLRGRAQEKTLEDEPEGEPEQAAFDG